MGKATARPDAPGPELAAVDGELFISVGSAGERGDRDRSVLRRQGLELVAGSAAVAVGASQSFKGWVDPSWVVAVVAVVLALLAIGAWFIRRAEAEAEIQGASLAGGALAGALTSRPPAMADPDEAWPTAAHEAEARTSSLDAERYPAPWSPPQAERGTGAAGSARPISDV